MSDLFGVPLLCLPEVRDSAGDFGTTQGVPGLPDGIPVRAAIGDSHAALFGHGAFRPGDGKVTFGTGSSIMTTLPEFIAPERGITTTIAWRIGGRAPSRRRPLFTYRRQQGAIPTPRKRPRPPHRALSKQLTECARFFRTR